MGRYRFVKAVSTRRSDPILQIRQQFSRDACDLVHGDVEHLFVGLRRLAIAGYFTDGLEGGGINLLTSNRLTDLGGGSTFHDNRVELKKI